MMLTEHDFKRRKSAVFSAYKANWNSVLNVLRNAQLTRITNIVGPIERVYNLVKLRCYSK